MDKIIQAISCEMRINEIIEIFRFEMVMLTFDFDTGESCDPSRYGKDANRLFHALNDAIDILSKVKQGEYDKIPIPQRKPLKTAENEG